MTVTIDIVSLLMFILGTVVVIVSVSIVYFLWRKVRDFLASRKYDAHDRNTLRARWREIEAMLDGPGDMSLKLAVLEADKLLEAGTLNKVSVELS